MNKKQNKKKKISKKTILIWLMVALFVIAMGAAPVYMPLIYQDELSSGEVLDYMANMLSMVASVILSYLAIYQTNFIRQQDERREIERVKPRLVLKSELSTHDYQQLSLCSISESMAYGVEISFIRKNGQDKKLLNSYECLAYGGNKNITINEKMIGEPLKADDRFYIDISYSDCEYRKYLMNCEILYKGHGCEKSIIRLLRDELEGGDVSDARKK